MESSFIVSRASRLKSAFGDVLRLMRETQTPGLGLGVILDGEVVVSEGFGMANVEERIMTTDETVFAIGSLSKAFTAAACGILVADGALQWDQPISEHLPNFYSAQEKKVEQFGSIVDILSHSTGFPDFPTLYLGFDGSLLSQGDKAEEKILKIISSLPFQEDEFQSVWRYNALAYSIPSMIIEKLTGKSFEEFLVSKIFSKLGMHATTLLHSDLPGHDGSTIAKPYVVMPDNSLKDIPLVEYGAGTHFAASCGLQSSTKDLLIWAEEIMNSWHSEIVSNGVVPKSTVLKEMGKVLQPVCHFPPLHHGNASYALGWFQMVGQYISDNIFDEIPAALINIDDSFVDNTQITLSHEDVKAPKKVILFHSGRVEGFTSSIHIFPETRDAVIVLGNSTGSVNGVDWIARLVISILTGQGTPENFDLGMKAERDERQNRWKRMHQRWLENKASNGLALPTAPSDIVGVYINDAFGLQISIFLSSQKMASDVQRGLLHQEEEDQIGPRWSLSVSFFADYSHSILLTHYCGTVYSFFPSREEFVERAKSFFQNESQFLLHIHIEDGMTTGLWWQFHPTEDGLWFARSS